MTTNLSVNGDVEEDEKEEWYDPMDNQVRVDEVDLDTMASVLGPY